MAEALVSTILAQIASLKKDAETTGFIKQYNTQIADLDKLSTKLDGVQVVLRDAETRQGEHRDVRDWLDQLKDTSYDIEDVLDEWSTTISREIEDASKSFSKAGTSIPYNLSCCRKVVLPIHIAAKIKVLSRKLDHVIATKKDTYEVISKTEDAKQQMTTSAVTFPQVKICGRDQERNTLLSLLLTNSRQGPIFPIISMVGMRGSGKTALAQQAFNNKDVNTHFEKKIWVRVSGLSDEISIAKEILKNIDAKTPNLDSLETLFGEIRQCFQGIKFLLVLDDVCITGPKIWKEMRNLLRYNCQGSKILITIREQDNAKMVGKTSLISLGKLSNEECWSLFNEVAFAMGKIEEHPKLKEIGEQIVSKCNGLPLILKLLGGLLRSETGIEKWIQVRDSKFWELEVEKGFFSSLFLSYYDLPIILRKCLLSCAIFPKDYKLEKDTLIKLWMAQGHLKIEGREDMEKVGEECFQILAMCSFFYDFENNEHNNKLISFRMPDLIHDFAQFLAKNECCIIEVDGLKEFQFEPSYKKVRHVKVIEQLIPTSGFKKGKLLSLVNCGFNSKVEVDLSKLFEQLKCLRTLDLGGCSFEDLSGGIKNLIHLRYLNLSHNKYLKELPEALFELYGLQSLNINNCNNLKNLSPGIGKLTNLLHLINYGTPLSYVPKEVKQLTCLRTLNKFAVSDEKDDNKACKLNVLEKMNNLEGFLIITGLGNVSDKDEVNNAKLDKKQSLVALCLRFNGLTHVDDEVLFKDLEHPPNLEELMVQYYIGKTMSLEKLKSMEKLKVLKLSFCLEFEHLPALGKLKFLESLYISNMKNVKRVGKEFFCDGTGTMKSMDIDGDGAGASTSTGTGTAFPKLRTLKFDSMDDWVNWEDITIMPCLQSLTIGHCQKLEALPAEILHTLKKLKMYNCSRLHAS